jgi:hypothetical protein
MATNGTMIIDEESEMMWKGTAVIYQKCYPNIGMEGREEPYNSLLLQKLENVNNIKYFM